VVLYSTSLFPRIIKASPSRISAIRSGSVKLVAYRLLPGVLSQFTIWQRDRSPMSTLLSASILHRCGRAIAVKYRSPVSSGAFPSCT
jgi:hypothetical protein